MRMVPIRIKQLLTACRLTVGYSVYAKRPLSPIDCAEMYESLCEVCDLLDIEPIKIEEIDR